MTSFLKHLDYADNICLVSYRVINLGQMAFDSEREVNRVGLKSISNKTTVLILTVIALSLSALIGRTLKASIDFHI